MPKLEGEKREMLVDAFNLMSANQSPENTSDYFSSLIAQARSIARKHNNHPFASGLLLACLSEIERMAQLNESVQ